jgi:hypothetical protein
LSLNDLIASRREGHSMPQEFYTNAAVMMASSARCIMFAGTAALSSVARAAARRGGWFVRIISGPTNAMASSLRAEGCTKSITTSIRCCLLAWRIWRGCSSFASPRLRGRAGNDGTGRVTEALDTGAKTAAASCPFCLTMMTDGVAAKNDQVKVRDVSELMLEEN